ncbi:MAG TPA: FapA family protein [Negativicutes bacterium]
MNDDEHVLPPIEEVAKDLDGHFLLDLKDDGLFLTVHPPSGEGTAVREPMILEELKAREIAEYNASLVVRTVKEASAIPIKIAELPEEEKEPEISVIVSRDKMEAFLQIDLPKRSKPVILDQVMEKINSSGVSFGIDLEAVKSASELPGIRIKCATGQPPVNGTDAYIHYFIDMTNKGRPTEMEGGRVDFKNLNMFTIVEQGELLAEKIPLTTGTPGIDTLGQPIPPKPGKEVPMPLGKNVEVADTTKVIASMAGQLLIINNKINVIPVIEIKEDVDLSTGNIEFVGSVIVRGSVQSGFTVKAAGNVEIYGTVSGGTVEGKNIVIKMGIQGMQRGYVKASENIVAKFMENATVYAGNDVLVSDVLLHSRVNAGKRVIVEGSKGLITGGVIMAGEEIRAKVVGNLMSIATELGVGVNPMLREEYQTIRKDIKKMEISLDQTQKALVILKAMDQSTMPPEKKEMLLKLTKVLFNLVGQIETMRNRLNEIELALEEMRFGRIKVADTMYPGVKVVIGTLIKPIREALKFVSLYADEGEIKIGTYK